MKASYLLSCIILAVSLFGCKEQGELSSIFDGLPEAGHMTEIKSAIDSKMPVVIAFTAEWCPHCRHYKPVFFEVEKSFENEVKFLNIDVDNTNGSVISSRFQVRGIPTTAFVRKDGSVFKVQVGGIEKEDLTQVVKDLQKSRKKRRGEPVAPFPIEKIEQVELKPAKEKDVEKKEEVKEEIKQELPPQEIIKEETEIDEEKEEGDKPQVLPSPEVKEVKPEPVEPPQEVAPKVIQ